MNLEEKLRKIPDFPEAGITFIDITTVLKDPDAFEEVIRQMLEQVKDLDFDIIVGSESRGFIFGAALAYAAHKGFVPVRKPNKLPAETLSIDYDLEYGSNTLEIHKDAIKPGQKVLLVDDLLATGGTANASCKLVEELGGEIVGTSFFVELSGLGGREALKDYEIYRLLEL